MQHISSEDRLREAVKSSEQGLFTTRSELIKYYTVRDEKFIPDTRFISKVRELQNQENTLMNRIIAIEDALTRATEIGSKYLGCDKMHPSVWLLRKEKQLQGEINSLHTDITILNRQIDEQGGIAPGFDVSDGRGNILKRAPDPAEGWRQQVKEKEARLQELNPELEKIKNLLPQVEKVLQEVS